MCSSEKDINKRGKAVDNTIAGGIGKSTSLNPFPHADLNAKMNGEWG